MLKIFVPGKKGICGIAAAEFASIWNKITGKKPAVITAGSLLMPLAFPVGVLTNMLLLGGSLDEIIGGGGGTVINLLCWLGTIILAVLGSFIGWKVGSELKKAGKLK